MNYKYSGIVLMQREKTRGSRRITMKVNRMLQNIFGKQTKKDGILYKIFILII